MFIQGDTGKLIHNDILKLSENIDSKLLDMIKDDEQDEEEEKGQELDDEEEENISNVILNGLMGQEKRKMSYHL